MSKLFFDHLVIREEIDVELNSYQLTAEDRADLVEIIDSTLIHQVLNIVLNYLPKDKHPEFIDRFYQAPHDETLIAYLKLHAHPEIESEIKKHSAKIKKDILTEIKKSVKKSR